jgi:CubicO group peptidase (beta-lactamase class C family)
MTLRPLAMLLAALCVPLALVAQPAGSFDAVRPKMQAFVDKGEVAGVVTLVATRDTLLHLGAVGSSDTATGRKMRTDDIFWVASMSKPMTAVAIAILVDDGKISFDDPIQKYLPEFQPPPSQSITLRDVLAHTSGLGELTGRAPHLTLEQTSRQVAAEAKLRKTTISYMYGTEVDDRDRAPLGGAGIFSGS